jgi:hypothetical protein
MCRPHSEWCEKANRNFLLTSDNRMERHRLHPGNYPGRSPFPECVKLKRQALIKGWWLAPTLAGFYRVLNPWPQLLWAPSNHSATSAVMLPLYRPDFNRWECSLQHANCHELWHKHWGLHSGVAWEQQQRETTRFSQMVQLQHKKSVLALIGPCKLTVLQRFGKVVGPIAGGNYSW